MKAIPDERWQEIRDMLKYSSGYNAIDQFRAIRDVVEQHDHLDAQIKLLADYIMSKRSDDPAWKLGEGACAMAIEIMRREAAVIRELNEHMRWLGEGYDDPPASRDGERK